MESKVCVVCKEEKCIDNFYSKYRECKTCNSSRSSKRYFENKCKISNQEKCIMKKTEQNYYKNDTINIYIIENYLDHMLN